MSSGCCNGFRDYCIQLGWYLLMSLGFSLAFPFLRRGGFSPASLFALGEQGAWYDPSDLSTMFQDAAGTIPVTSSGQPVGLIRDKSGRGNHASQATAGSRPTYTEAGTLRYLVFDGVDDSLVAGSVSFTSTDKMTVFAGITKLSDTTGALVEHPPSFPTNGFAMFAPLNPGDITFRSAGATTQSNASKTSIPAPVSAVVTGIGDIGGNLSRLRYNGAVAFSNNTAQGGGNYGTGLLHIGRRAGASLPFGGRMYGLIIRAVASTAAEISNTEQYLSAKSGVTLA